MNPLELVTKTLYSFDGAEKRLIKNDSGNILNLEDFSGFTNSSLSASLDRKALGLGTSTQIDKNAPAWDLRLLKGRISSISGSYTNASGIINNNPRLHLQDILYKTSAIKELEVSTNNNFTHDGANQTSDLNLASPRFEDNSYIKIFDDYISKKQEQLPQLDDGATFFMSGYKKMFEDVGYFDGSTFFPCFCEDDDFLIRSKIKGYELKTINKLLSKSVTTNHHLNLDILAKYRAVKAWYIAVYEGILLKAIYRVDPTSLETKFSYWESRIRGGMESINNPKIPLSLIEKEGELVYPKQNQQTIPGNLPI
jgi:hypothetical protein